MPSGKKTKRQRQQQQKRPAAIKLPSAPAAKQRTISSWKKLSVLALIIVVGLLIYANTFNAPFLFDDKPNILQNPFIRVTHIDIDDLKDVLQSRSAHRPFANLTFALNYYFHQYDQTGYHIVNLAIHLISAFLVFLITRQTLSLLRFEKTWIAIPVALLWLVNPVHTQSVTYIVQRMNSMAAMFYMLAMACYIQGRLIQCRGTGTTRRQTLLFTGAVLAGLFGILSKEITVTLPVMLFLYEWYFFQNLDRNWFRKQTIWIIMLAAAFFILAMIYLKGDPLGEITSKYAKKHFTVAQRLLTEPGVVLYYLSLLFFPSPDRLRIVYQIFPSTSLFSPFATLLSFAGLAGLIGAVFLLRHRHRLTSFAIAWFLVTLSLESSIIPLALAFEHRAYLPSVFPFIALGSYLFSHTTVQKAMTVICAGILLCGIWTWQRNIVWTDQVVFWTDAAMKAPKDARTYNNLGRAYWEKGELEIALDKFRDSLKNNFRWSPAQDDAFAKAHSNIGLTLVDLKRPTEAIPYLKQAIGLNPTIEDAHFKLGVAFEILGEIKKAESSYAQVLKLNSFNEKAHNNIGLIKMNHGQVDDAITHFKRALAIDPYFENSYNNMGVACYKNGQAERALSYFRKALALNPDYSNASDNLDRATRAMKQYGQTIALLRQDCEKYPDDLKATGKLAAVCLQAGMEKRAVDLYEKILSNDAGCEECLDTLARIYWAAGRYDRAALKLAQQAQYYPDTPNIFYGLACAYAKSNQKEKAVETLKKSIARGYTDFDYIRNDEALAGIRDTEYFKTLTAE